MKGAATNSGIPTYVGVYNLLYSDLQKGVYPEGERLPGEVALAKQYGVSRNTLRQALAILAEDGLIIRSQGRETTVAHKHPPRPVDAMANPMKCLCRTEVDSFTCQFNYGAPTEIARDVLRLEDGDVVLASDCVYFSKGKPVGFSFIQVPIANLNALGVDVSNSASVETLLTRTLFEAAQERSFTIKLVRSHESEAHFLEVAEGTALILLEGLLTADTPRTLARFKFYFLPDHYDLTFRC